MSSTARKIQRLSVRGKLTIRFDMKQTVRRKYMTPGTTHGTTTEFNEIDRPHWTVSLERRSRYPHWVDSRISAFVWDMVGINNVYVEADELDLALDEALGRSEPRRVWLDDRVWEHQAFIHDCRFVAYGVPKPAGYAYA